MVTFGNGYFGLNTAKALQGCLFRWMYTTKGNFFITLYAIPLVFQVMTVEGSGLEDIVGGDGLVGPAEEDVGRELAAYNGDIRGEVHT